VRVRDHIVLSAAGAALAGPWAGRDALGVWAGGVLIDADHYVWFCARRHRANPVSAAAFFNGARPPQHRATRVLHSPAVLLAVLLAGARRPRLLPVALGMGLHVALDAQHVARMNRARAIALQRDGYSCRACGTRAADVTAHVWRQPWLLPSYQEQNLVTLCHRCHEAAHAPAGGGAPWRSRAPAGGGAP
jgi:hypothetical protein